MKLPALVQPIFLVLSFLAFFDRALLPPLLPLIAREFGVPIETIGMALVAYVIAYAVAQLGWSVVSARLGRVRTLAIASGLALVGITITALASDPLALIVGRTISGAAIGATVPTVLTYFGDAFAMKARGMAAANLAAALSVGLTVGTLVASYAAEWFSWRLAFGIAALLTAALGVLLLFVAEPVRVVPQKFFPSIVRVARNRWAIAVLALTVLEGSLLVGVLNYVPVAVQERGFSVVVAGLVTGAFGVSVVISSQLTKAMLRVLPSWLLLAIGGGCAVVAYLLLAIDTTPPLAGAAAVLLGLSWALAHTQMQTWMTDAVFDARPVGMSLFAVALFGGGSIGVVVGNLAAETHSFGALFAAAAVAALAFTVVGSAARARYRLREQG